MRRWALLTTMLALAALPPAATDALAQTPPGPASPGPASPGPASTVPATPPAAPALVGPPHEWVFGSWTGGQFPPGEGDTPACFGSPTVIFTRDLVLRATALDTIYRQRIIETVARQPDALEFRFSPMEPVPSAFGNRVPPDAGFGCAGNPDALRVERRGPNEIVFPGCNEFPSPLKRCVSR